MPVRGAARSVECALVSRVGKGTRTCWLEGGSHAALPHPLGRCGITNMRSASSSHFSSVLIKAIRAFNKSFPSFESFSFVSDVINFNDDLFLV